LETIFDQDKLEKILFNLLSNAFKFTPAKGEVSVVISLDARPDGNWVAIRVSDTGIGIPEDKIDRIFERFFQHELPRTMMNQGSGIGLSITHEFVRISKGEIEVKSRVGEGSQFTVRLPAPEIKIASSAAPAALLPVYDAPAESEVSPETPEMPSSEHTLLLIEDNDDFRFYLKDNLKLAYRIYEAASGEMGWDLCLKVQPDLIVSDVMMPGMNGIELCRKIKSDERVSHIPVILLTARNSEDQRLEGFETGADDYITKPFNFEILESRIRNLIALRIRSQKNFRKTLEVKASELNITPLDTRFIENAVKCVEKHVSSPDFSVEDLGRELGFSRAYLYKKIVALTGKSPLEFIRHIRLQHAAQLLEKSQMTVAEVAYQVGFNNPKYFARYFKDEFKELPSGYAAARRNTKRK
jgi:DNA-binding response OmpR family regulator